MESNLAENMQTNTIQQQYDEVIAPHYDLDPQGVTVGSLQRAVKQLQQWGGDGDGTPLRVFDVGMGTGRFLELMRAGTGWPIQPFGLDLSERMLETAKSRVPGLAAVVDDARNLDAHFPAEAFDLIATHYITGFVPIDLLAAKIHARLAPGGCWSLIGGTMQGFPTLRHKADSKLLRKMFGGKGIALDGLVCNPADRTAVEQALERAGFVIRACETFEPPLRFANLNEFLEFGYYGGWLTPFVEALNLHQASKLLRLVLNTLVFPVEDHHQIVIALAEKPDL
jgi:SAM-dependent methyltransferase